MAGKGVPPLHHEGHAVTVEADLRPGTANRRGPWHRCPQGGAVPPMPAQDVGQEPEFSGGEGCFPGRQSVSVEDGSCSGRSLVENAMPRGWAGMQRAAIQQTGAAGHKGRRWSRLGRPRLPLTWANNSNSAV